jgi:FkbM family methyltransferase
MKKTKKLKNSLLRLFGRQDWIRVGGRDRILRLFCNPETVTSCEYEADFFGLRYQGNLAHYLDWCVYFYGAYEKQELFLLRDLLQDQKDPIFVDIGANVGQHSLFMSQHCSWVHSFEPYEPVRCSLENKILKNKIGNIKVHNIALGDQHQELEFFAPTGSNLGTGSFISSHETDNNKLLGKVNVVQGDDFFRKLSLDKINVIKIDVEGFEKSVLLGLQKTLEIYHPFVVMEFSISTKMSFSSESEMLALFPNGYRVKHISAHNKCCVVFNRNKYILKDFDFNAPDSNILFFPENTLSSLQIN